MTLEEKVGKLFMIGLPGKSMDAETVKILERVNPGSIILFSRNIENPSQVKDFIDECKRVLGYKPLIAIDQEGGIVTRLTKGFAISPGAMAIAATGNSENAFIAASILAKEMRAVGIDWDLAPVVDINNNPNNPGIGVRSFSSDVNTVVEFGRKFTKGLQENGIIACLKHFPGKGRVSVDAHIDMPVLDVSYDELKKFELIPFKKIEALSWMPSHIYIPALQHTKIPATLSEEILTELVRKKLHYKGVLIADDLLMGGITNYFPVEEATLKAFAAGMDILTVCHNDDIQIAVKNYLVKQIEKEPKLQKRLEESLSKIEAMKKLINKAPKIEIKLVGSDEHINEMQHISDEAITLLKNKDNLIPLQHVDNVFTVVLSRLVQVEDEKEGIPWISQEIAKYTNAEFYTFDLKIKPDQINKYIKKAVGKVNVIFTENAHLFPGQRALAEEISKVGKTLIVALRNPYDCFIEGVENAIASYGYTPELQKSLFKVLTGKIKAKGKLPVVNR
ncbi:beta-N-acetylhexosaminidase [Kosmotoga olearia]|uniref:Beta-N-acetylhexosaminidase n=2 Tax=Kosmotoga TaxID=651456 RepID=C5CH66_KOSOT|nr:beta-N-acetylhexosaminidase [Kosmotoga olearia]ACR80669.1 Beta-N-acetylhexosaminidase [Kosmotoga olearia TBF 19.5.1]MDI3495364.1 beta-N-acetylhexosaminidase [Pseudothermotoga sp.]